MFQRWIVSWRQLATSFEDVMATCHSPRIAEEVDCASPFSFRKLWKTCGVVLHQRDLNRVFMTACLDDDACISYDFVVGSQAASCRFYSEATLPENRAEQTSDLHCGPTVKEGCDLTFAWGEYSGFYTLSSKVILPSRRFVLFRCSEGQT